MAISAGSIPCPPYIQDQEQHRKAITQWMMRVSPFVTSDTSSFVTGNSLSAALAISNAGAFNVKSYGAVGDDATDNLLAIQAAIDACQLAGGGVVLVPPGIYRVSGTITIAAGVQVTLQGAGRAATTIKTTHATANLLVVNAWYSSIRGINFESSVVRTAGIMVHLFGVETTIRDFMMTGDYIGIKMEGVACRIEDGNMPWGASGGKRIWVTGGDTSQIINRMLLGAQVAPFPSSGIYVDSSSALMITDTSVITSGLALHIAPGTGQGVFSLYASNCFFDNSSTGINIDPTGTGNVVRCRFTNCWTSSSSGNGVNINLSGGGILSGLHFIDLHSMLNGASGISITSPGITDVSVIGGEICQNTAHGIFIAGSTTDFTIVDATIGTGGGMSGNTIWGIVVGAACDRFIISNNRLTGNGSGTLFDSSVTSNKTVLNNIPSTGGGSTGLPIINIKGDVTGSGSATITCTLATVNSNIGIVGNEYAAPIVQINGKGLVTAALHRNIKAKGMDGLQSGNLTTTADGSVHLTFPVANFNAVPFVVANATGTTAAAGARYIMTTGSVSAGGATFYATLGDGTALAGWSFQWIALGATANVDTYP